MMNSLANTIIYGSAKDVEQWIVHERPDMNVMDEYGYNPMVEAAIMQKKDVAEVLFRHGALVNFPDSTGRSALHWATDNHDMNLCRFLLENNANPNAYSVIGQPVLAYPYLRNQIDLKTLLYQYGANLIFTQDYINAKLIGHRFELQGKTHIVNASGDFILVDYEGFMFEFTAGLIQDSLQRFIHNYAAKHLQNFQQPIDEIIQIFATAAELIKYQQFSVQIKQHENKIDQLLDKKILLIPIVYTGHAVTGILTNGLFIKCDRGEYGRTHATVTVYKINKPELFNKKLIKRILYQRNPENFIHYGLNELLDLTPLHTLPLPPQISGNCSWANVEAAIPALLFILFLRDLNQITKTDFDAATHYAINFFNEWHEWDQDRALDECIQSFYHADPKRKATKAQILAGILVHHCDHQKPKHLQRAEKILPILRTKDYEYILNAYVKEFTRDPFNPLGKNLKDLLDIVGTK